MCFRKLIKCIVDSALPSIKQITEFLTLQLLKERYQAYTARLNEPEL